MSREANGDVMLLVRLRRDADVPKDVTLGVSCGAGCGGKLPFADTLAALPAGKWQTVGVPLKCFPKAGADVSKVNETLEHRVERQARRVALAGQARHRGRQGS